MADPVKPPPPSKPKPKTPFVFHYDEPKKSPWLKRILIGAFIVIAVAAIIAMIYTNKRMPSLNCQEYNGDGLWSSFGRCSAD